MNGADVLAGTATWAVEQSDCLAWLRSLPDDSIQCCVTSPPYFALRDYGCEGQIGLEKTPAEYVAKMVDVFRELRRVLKDDGTLWLNLGDSYNAYNGNRGRAKGVNKNSHEVLPSLPPGHGLTAKDAKPKDLLGIPWRVAFALQAEGWYLRQDMIWSKPNPMPESVTDRCTKAHEYLFLLTKSSRYYYDQEAIAEPCTDSTIERISQPNLANQKGSYRQPGKTNGPMKAVVKKPNGGASFGKQKHDATGTGAQSRTYERPIYETRNRRSVWTIATKSFKGAHFAVMPAALVEPCILAGTRPGDVVLDPFTGSGTVAVVALKLGRRFIGSELNPAYIEIIRRRVAGVVPSLPGLQ